MKKVRLPAYPEFYKFHEMKAKLKNVAWTYFFFSLTILTGSNLGITSNVGLDASWWTLTIDATRNDQIRTGEFIGTYGPLGFLDFTLIYWKLGILLGTLWKILISGYLFFLTQKLLEQKQQNKLILNGLLAMIFVTVMNAFLPPSLLIVITALAFWANQKFNNPMITRNKEIIFSIATSMMLLTKMLPGVLMLMLTVSIILHHEYPKREKRITILKKIISYLLFVNIWIFAILILLGFNLNNMVSWARGYFEMTAGYRAMATEEPGRLWEYFAVFLLFILIYLSVQKYITSNFELLVDLVFFYTIFTYGFIRHDVHSITTFAILFATIFFIYLTKKESKAVLLALSFLVLIGVSGFQVLNLIEISKPISNSVTLLKVQEKNFSENYKISNINALRSVYSLSPEMLKVIGNHSVSIYPIDQVAAKAWDLKLKSPPAPQLITAYSDWLDGRNVEWIKSTNASKFMLWSQRRSIDGRNPNWDSPRFQLETICNYRPVLSDNSWMLLERQPTSRCGNSRFLTKLRVPENMSEIDYQIPIFTNEIVTMKIEKKFVLKDEIIPLFFKPLQQDRIRVDGQPYYFLENSKRDLIISTPQVVDFPMPYSYGQKNTLQIPENLEIEIFATPIID